MVEQSTEPKGWWQSTKDWAASNRVVAGGIVGAGIGVSAGGVGIIPGAMVGAGIGYFSAKEDEKSKVQSLYGAGPSPTRYLDLAVAVCMVVAAGVLTWLVIS